MKKDTNNIAGKAATAFSFHCRFCGQHGKLDAYRVFKDQAEAIEAATLTCNCQEARNYQTRKDNIEKLHKAADSLRAYLTDRKYDVKDELLKLFFDCGVSALDGFIRKVSLELFSVKITIQRNRKSYLLIAFKSSDGYQVEI